MTLIEQVRAQQIAGLAYMQSHSLWCKWVTGRVSRLMFEDEVQRELRLCYIAAGYEV